MNLLDTSRVSLKLQIAIVLLFFAASPAYALVNINTATSAELQSLNGIGPAYAQRIIDYRNTNGPFSQIDDIQNVTGIGPATFEKIKNDITVDGATTVQTATTSGGSSSTSSGTTSSSVVVYGEKKVLKPVGGLIIKAPDHAFVGQTISFDVEPTDGTNGRLVRYSWSFGDGSTAEFKSPTHSYDYPGTYVLVVESDYLKSNKIQRTEITVVPMNFSLRHEFGGGVTLTNNSDYEIDLNGLSLSGKENFVFPAHTVLLPGRSITIGQDDLELGAAPVALHNQFGRVVAIAGMEAAADPVPRVLGRSVTVTTGVSSGVSQKSAATAAIVPMEETSTEEETITTTTPATPVEKSKVPTEAWPYLALIMVVGIGIFALFGTGKSVV